MTNETPALPIWAALSDPKRRQILQLLQEKARTTSELCAHFDVSRFAVMKHLNVLEEAGLIRVERQGRQRWNLLNEAALRQLPLRQLADDMALASAPPASPMAAALAAAPPLYAALAVPLPAPAAAVFQALTADVDAWWPQREQAGSRMVLEGVVNGRFYERFDDADRGVLLGVVTLIKPREQIRFSGPLGIADKAAISSVSWVLEPDGPRTTLHVQHALFGDVDEVTRDACLNWWREVMGHYLARYLVSEPRRWYQDDTETGHGLARKSTDKVA